MINALDKVTSLNRPSLHQELTAKLCEMIVEGVLVEGEKVPERELCEKLGVSRTPIREALKVLATDGLITLEPNRGARVRSFTISDLEEVFPVLAAIEALAGELACINISEVQLTNISNTHKEMLDCFSREDMPGYFKLNQKIHALILEAAGNPTLSAVHQSLAVRARRARYVANMSKQRWQQAVNEHEEMITELRARNGKKLGAILKKHLENKFSTVRARLEEQQKNFIPPSKIV